MGTRRRDYCGCVQEFCPGGSLRDAIERGAFNEGGSGRNRWHAALAVLGGVAAGMAFMHARRICHGELDPANILLHVRACPPAARSRCTCESAYARAVEWSMADLQAAGAHTACAAWPTDWLV
jgi:serine/threonine protein kinase